MVLFYKFEILRGLKFFMKKCQKRNITLLEIMIVIFLIGIIGGVLGYNMKGSLEKGKMFKTEQAMAQIQDILLLEAAKEGISLETVVENPKGYLKSSGLIVNEDVLLKDGWGQEMKISLSAEGNIIVTSDKYNSLLAARDKAMQGQEKEQKVSKKEKKQG
jgi:type II secretory pathway pseudopilin PulG